MISKKEMKHILLAVAKKAYDEGRAHQSDDDFPDVGFKVIPNDFEHTEIFDIIMKEGKV